LSFGARLRDHLLMRAWTNADEEAFSRSVLRRRWLNALRRGGVLTVG